MPTNDIFRYADDIAKVKESNEFTDRFKTYLKSFKTANGDNGKSGDEKEFMTDDEIVCWKALKKLEKGEDEETYSYDISEFTEEDCEKAKKPSTISDVLGNFEWAVKTETTFDKIQRGEDGSSQVVTHKFASVRIFNLIKSVDKELGILRVYSEVPRIVNKRLDEIQKQKEKEAQEKGEGELGQEDDKTKGKGVAITEQSVTGVSRQTVDDERAKDPSLQEVKYSKEELTNYREEIQEELDGIALDDENKEREE